MPFGTSSGPASGRPWEPNLGQMIPARPRHPGLHLVEGRAQHLGEEGLLVDGGAEGKGNVKPRGSYTSRARQSRVHPSVSTVKGSRQAALAVRQKAQLGLSSYAAMDRHSSCSQSGWAMYQGLRVQPENPPSKRGPVGTIGRAGWAPLHNTAPRPARPELLEAQTSRPRVAEGVHPGASRRRALPGSRWDSRWDRKSVRRPQAGAAARPGRGAARQPSASRR